MGHLLNPHGSATVTIAGNRLPTAMARDLYGCETRGEADDIFKAWATRCKLSETDRNDIWERLSWEPSS